MVGDDPLPLPHVRVNISQDLDRPLRTEQDSSVISQIFRLYLFTGPKEFCPLKMLGSQHNVYEVSFFSGNFVIIHKIQVNNIWSTAGVRILHQSEIL